MEIGEVIKLLMKKKGLKQTDVAKNIGRSKTTLSLIMNGVSTPQPETLEKISKELGVPVPVLHFLSITEDMVPEANRPLFRALGPSMEKYLLDVFDTNSENLKISEKAL